MSATVYIYIAPNFPDEGVDDGHDWIVYPGQVVAGVMSDILRELGCKVGQIYDEGFKGWEFNFSYDGVQLWTRVGKIEDFLIVFSVKGWLDIFGRRRRVFADLLKKLNETLKSDPRFHNIRWYTQKRMDAGEWDYPEKGEPDEAEA